MLEIFEGSEAKVKEEMKKLKAEHKKAVQHIQNEIKNVKARIRLANKKKVDTSKEQTLLKGFERAKDNLDNQGVTLMKLSVIPVRIGDGELVYNLKFLKEIERKLKGFEMDVLINSRGTMVISYHKSGSKGRFEIEPLPYIYRTLSKLPKTKAKYTKELV